MITDGTPRSLPSAVTLVPPPEHPSFFDELGAAFRLNNPAASLAAYEGPWLDERSKVDPGFDIGKEVIGSKYEPYLDQAWDIMNRSAFEKWKLQVDREEEDRKVYDASGWTGTGLGFVASVLDPTIALPGGALVKGARGYSIAKSALLTGTAGGGAMAVQEAALQGSQELRTGEEAAFSIGGGMLVGALLGAGGAHLLGRAESKVMARRLEAITNSHIPDEQAENEGLLRNAVGAASSPELSLDDLTPVGAVPQAMAKVGAMARLNVASYLLVNPSAYARELGMSLAGNHVYLKMFEKGKTLGTSTHQAVKRWTESSVGAPRVYKSLNENYKAFRKRGGAMTFKQFSTAVGDAAFRGGASIEPEVGNVAREYRALDNDMWRAAQEVGWNTRPQTDDESHGMRIWHRPKIESQEPAFKAQAAAGYEDMARTAMNKRNDSRLRLTAKLQQRVEDLTVGPEEAGRRVGVLTQHLAAIEKGFPEGEATRLEMKKLIGQRNRAPTSDIRGALNYQIKDLRDKAGKDYADYVTARTTLRSRLSNIKKSVGAGLNKEEAIRDQILDMAISNIGHLEKLHTNLSKLDQRMLDESPEEYLAGLSEARTKFAQVLDKNNALEVKLATARAEAEEAKREAASIAQPAMEKRKEKTAKTLDIKQTQDQKQIAQLTELANKIEALEMGDPEAAVGRLRELARMRMEQSALKIEKEAIRIGKKLGEKPSEEAALRAKGITERIARANGHFEDLVGPSGGYLKNGALVVDDADLRNYGREMADNLFDHVTGRVEPKNDYEITPINRGVLRNRIVAPNYERMKDFLDTDIREMTHRQTRRTGADIELRRRFGSATLDTELDKVTKSYAKLREGVEDPKKLRALGKAERRTQTAIQALRDMLRGTYMAKERSTPAGRILSGISQINFMRALGGVLIANVTDTVRPAMVMGLRPFLQDGIAPMQAYLRGIKPAVGRAIEDSNLAGIGTERWSHSRTESLAGLTDMHNDRSPVENFLEQTSQVFARATGLLMFTDYMKDLTSVMLQQRIIKDAVAGKMTAHSALIGLGEADLRRIAEQFGRHGFTDDEGFHVANTKHWDGPEGERTAQSFYGALNAAVDTIITTPNIADLPLAAHHPYLRPMFQFRAFNFAAQQAILMRGLQDPVANLIGGMVALTTIGMAGAYFRAVVNNRVDEFTSKGPDYLIVKGLDSSGLFSVLFDVNNVMEKGLGIGAYMATGGDPGAFRDKSFTSTLLGPTGDFVDTLSRVASHAAGGNLRGSDVNGLKNLLPVVGLPYISAPLNYFVMPKLKEAVSEP